MNCSKMYLGAMSTKACLAEGVIPWCTTMIARVMFSSCMRWQYLEPEGEERERGKERRGEERRGKGKREGKERERGSEERYF